MMKKKTIAAILSAAFLVAAAPADKTPYVAPATPDSVTHAVARVGGVSIAYTARAGTITLRNAKDQITARMFYTAFTKDGADLRNRPVTFFYNGGPGSSTIWLRMGSFAPMRVQTRNYQSIGTPPFNLINNDYSLLDKTDEVFVVAPATGYSRILGGGSP